MLYHIRHQTRYEFQERVFVEPQVLRFRPRNDPAQDLESFELKVEPQPAGLSHGVDIEGNAFALAWFNEQLKTMHIDVRATVRTNLADPFNYFVLDGGQAPLPWMAQTDATARFLKRNTGVDADPVSALASRLAVETPGVVGFLRELNLQLHASTRIEIRDEGPPDPAAVTLARASGSCRDLAVLFVDACRAVGVPARFVSGYQEGDPSQRRRDLHAWAEAFIPGAGWRGYDPTLGLVVADRHIVVAAAPNPVDAAPVAGTYRGDAPAVSPTYSIEVERLLEAALRLTLGLGFVSREVRPILQVADRHAHADGHLSIGYAQAQVLQETLLRLSQCRPVVHQVD